MLYATLDNGSSAEWHVGEPFSVNPYNVEKIQVDGDELELVSYFWKVGNGRVVELFDAEARIVAAGIKRAIMGE